MSRAADGPPAEPEPAGTCGRKDAPSLRDQPLRDVLKQMSAGRPAPAAGSAAAVAAGMGAALAAKTARLSRRQLPDAEALAHLADALRDRALDLAEADAAGVAATMSADGAGPPDPSAVPLEISQLAGEVARLADQLSQKGNPRLHADAVASRHLAEAADGAVDAIVRSNQGSEG